MLTKNYVLDTTLRAFVFRCRPKAARDAKQWLYQVVPYLNGAVSLSLMTGTGTGTATATATANGQATGAWH